MATLTNQDRFGANVRNRRHALGLSLEEAAHKIGVHWSHLSRLERGVKEPKLNTICDVARGLSVTPADLMRGLK